MAERCRHDILEDCPDCLRDTIADLVKALQEIAAFADYKEGTGGFLGPRLSGMASAGDIARRALAVVGSSLTPEGKP